MKLEDIAETIKDLPMYPYFDMVEAINAGIALRDPDDTENTFSRHHPLSNYFAVLLNIYACKISVHMMTALPILEEFKDTNVVIIATLMWYLVNFSPMDYMYKACRTAPLSILLLMLGEIQRTFKIYETFSDASLMYPDNSIISISLAVLRGGGDSFQSLVIQLIRGMWEPHSIEFMKPGLDTKASLLAALTFVIHSNNLFPGSVAMVYMVVVFFVVGLKLLAYFLESDNVFAPLESFLYTVFIGFWDAISRLFGRKNDVVCKQLACYRRSATCCSCCS